MVDRINLSGTDLQVSKICLGMMSYGNPSWQNWVLDKQKSRLVINYAIDQGINFFDTADLYSDGESENIIGAILKERSLRSRCVIATKAGYPTTEVKGSGFAADRLEAALDASLRRLNTDYIDLYQLHAWDPKADLDTTLELLGRFRAAGKIRYFGICNFTYEQIEDLLHKSADVSSYQGQYNILYRGVESRILPLLNRKKTSFLSYSPLARGYITERNLDITHRKRINLRLEEDKKGLYLYKDLPKSKILDDVRSVASERGMSISASAISWVLSKAAVSSVIFGASEIDQIEEAVRASSVKLSNSEILRMEENSPLNSIKLQDVNNEEIIDHVNT